MAPNDFLPQSDIRPDRGEAAWRAHSNIALVKYWGKHGEQLPANPSVSFTLDSCATTTMLGFEPHGPVGEGFDFDVFMDDRPEPGFRPKIATFFNRIHPYVPFLDQGRFTIRTSNTFPHSSGIASSASGMAALALCLVDLERQWGAPMTEAAFYRKASFLARLGSGSAARSVYGGCVVWGNMKTLPGSSDLFAIPYPKDIHPVFQTYADTVLVVEKGAKPVGSSVGHDLMQGHPFAQKRFEEAKRRIAEMEEVLALGHVGAFIGIVEAEALELHAMMLTATPNFILMRPNTLEIIHRIRDFRETSGVPICFTLDAGANVHVLYPISEEATAHGFIIEDLVAYCENGQYIRDKIGNGPKKL